MTLLCLGRRSVRAAAPALLVVVCGSAGAGTISGTVAFEGKRPAAVKAGYVGLAGGGLRVSNSAGMTLGDFGGSVTCTTWKPRNATVVWDPAKGLRYRHTELPPGRYLVWVRCGENYMDWRLVHLTQDRPSATANFAFSRAAQGDLRLMVARSAKSYNVRISPLGKDGRPPLPGADVPMYVGWDTDVKGGAVLLAGMKAGKYQVELRSQVKHTDGGSGWSAVLTDEGVWSVEVVRGREREYRLR
jgi:hypothetical protein